MEKKFFKLFPYYSFDCDQTLLQELLQDVKNIPSEISNHANVTLINNHNCFYNEKLIDWLDVCLLKIKAALYIKNEIDLPVISCWANKSTKLQGHHVHHHPNSFLSGILYLTSHESGFTHFIHDNYWLEHVRHYTISTNNIIEEKIKPEAGKLIIFPSHLKHKVTGLTSNETRYTIAFNVFISGKLGEFSADLTLTTPSLRELIK